MLKISQVAGAATIPNHKHKRVYDEVMEKTQFLAKDSSFSLRWFYWENHLTEPVLCKCGCQKFLKHPQKTKFLQGHSNSDKEVKKNKQKALQAKYGDEITNVSQLRRVDKEIQKERDRVYRQSPEYKAKQKARRDSPEYKAKQKARRESPEYKAKQKDYAKVYRQQNKESLTEYNCRYRMKNKHKKAECSKRYYQKNRDNAIAYQAKYGKARRKVDPLFRAQCALRRSVATVFERLKQNKPTNTLDLLGCSWEEAIRHFESLFKKGMSWLNHGEWHIDHIRPVASFSPEELLKANHISNLQPLWAHENLAKGDRYESTKSELHSAPKEKTT